MEALRRTFYNFKDKFNFLIETWEIEAKNSLSKLRSKVPNFVVTAKKDDLLIDNYSGEGRLNTDRELTLIRYVSA
jgi:hypothetical protein